MKMRWVEKEVPAVTYQHGNEEKASEIIVEVGASETSEEACQNSEGGVHFSKSGEEPGGDHRNLAREWAERALEEHHDEDSEITPGVHLFNQPTKSTL